MPIYDYKCTDEECGHITERRCKISERNDPLECEKCGSNMEMGIMSSNAVLIRKGPGWTPAALTQKSKRAKKTPG